MQLMLSVLEDSALITMIGLNSYSLFASADLALIADNCSAAIIAPLASYQVL